jgi:hypothetical protein
MLQLRKRCKMLYNLPWFKEFVQFDICFPKDAGESAQWAVMKRLHEKILFRDPRWHFFYEGTFFRLRCSRVSAPWVMNVLRKIGWASQAKLQNQWGDENPVVIKYRKHFAIIFHQFSELFMELEYEDCYRAVERISHASVLNTFYINRPQRIKSEALRKYPLKFEEQILLGFYTHRTSYVDHYYEEMNKLRGFKSLPLSSPDKEE